MISDSIHDRTNFNTASEHEIFGDRDLPSWLTQQQISLACTTYQTSRLMLIGAVPETYRISAFWRIFDRAIGLFCTPSRIYLALQISTVAIRQCANRRTTASRLRSLINTAPRPSGKWL